MKTLRDLFLVGTSQPKAQHLRWRDPSGRWRALSTPQVVAQVGGLARALRQRGLVKGDRVALLARNSPRWAMTDYAAVTSGLVVVPIYPTLAPDQVRFILDDSGARVFFVEDAEQHERLRSVLEDARLDLVVILEGALPEGCRTRAWSDLVSEGGDEESLPESAISPEDLATFVYTSGTTGNPKGVMLTHGNLVSNALGCAAAIDLAPIEHVNLSLLPLCHIFQRLVDYYLFMTRAVMVYCPNPLDAMEWFPIVRPTFFAAVPRLYEKIHSGFDSRLAKEGPLRQALVRWALRVGRARFEAWCRDGACDGKPSAWLELQHRIADFLVLRKIRAIFGGRVDAAFSGGAPLSTETGYFLRSIGLPLLPGYGLTESSPVLNTNTKTRIKLGTVGPALPGVELKVAEDGELLARGPNIMKGYWQRPEDTAASIIGGWLHTGDLAREEPGGYFAITGRKKEILVLSTGKKVQPLRVEDFILRSKLVTQCVAVGDGQKFVGALVWPNLERLDAEARKRGLGFESKTALLGLREARALVQESVDQACAPLSEFERPKTVALLSRELSLAQGELTPTLKLKRREIVANWGSLIESLFTANTRKENA